MKQKRIEDRRFGMRLRQLRSERCLTGTELCEQFNKMFDSKLNASTISRYENFTQEPMLNTVALLARFVGVSPVYLIGQSDDREGSKTSADCSEMHLAAGDLSDDEAELLRIFKTLGSRDRHELMQLAFDLEEKQKNGGK